MNIDNVSPIRRNEVYPRTKMRIESVLLRIGEVTDVLVLYQAARCEKDVSALSLAERELDLIAEELRNLASDLGE